MKVHLLLLSSSLCLASSNPINVRSTRPRISSPLRHEVIIGPGRVTVIEIEDQTSPLLVPRLKFTWMRMQDLLNPPSELTPDGFFLRAVFSSEEPRDPNQSPPPRAEPK